MPDITVAQSNYTKADAGFDFLQYVTQERTVEITGTDVGTLFELRAKDDAGVEYVIATVVNSDLPYLKVISRSFKRDLELNVTGSPNCNVSGSNQT